MRRVLFTFLSAIALIAAGVVGAVAVGGTGTVDPPPRIAFLANGIVPADALAAGGIAGQLGAPLFTTRADVLEQAAEDAIVAYNPALVIALGGEVAIQQSVLDALATATGLAMTTAENPTDGIVRVGGETRFDTAVLIADLLAAYDPAYLPVDATALGAVDADKVDGMDADEFALSGTSCAAGDVVTGIGTDGTPDCAPDLIDGGDADLLDGFDSARFVTKGTFEVPSLGNWQSEGTAGADVVHFTSAVVIPDSGGRLALNKSDFTAVNNDDSLALASIELCVSSGGAQIELLQVEIFRVADTGAPTEVLELAPFSWDQGAGGCQTLDVTPGLRSDGIPLDGRHQVSLRMSRTGTGASVIVTSTSFNYFRPIGTAAP